MGQKKAKRMEGAVRAVVSSEEQRLIEAAAARENRSVSAWVRLKLLPHLALPKDHR